MLAVHAAEAAVRPDDHTGEKSVLSSQLPVGVQQFLQRIGFDIGIVVHRPDPGITHLDCLLHTKCETARTAEIGTGVKVMQTRIGKTLTDHLFRSVAARIVNNEDVTGGVFLFP